MKRYCLTSELAASMADVAMIWLPRTAPRQVLTVLQASLDRRPSENAAGRMTKPSGFRWRTRNGLGQRVLVRVRFVSSVVHRVVSCFLAPSRHLQCRMRRRSRAIDRPLLRPSRFASWASTIPPVSWPASGQLCVGAVSDLKSPRCTACSLARHDWVGKSDREHRA